jgi:glycosyltransferase involved in cell wall biosynthesis
MIGYDIPGVNITSYPIPSNVHVFRNWPNQAVLQAWRQCAFGVIPSTCAEACPTVAMEAMDAGQAVIASDIGGIGDVVANGETGLLIDPGNADALLDAMQLFISNPDMVESYGRAGLKRVERFKAPNVVSKIERIYQDLLT